MQPLVTSIRDVISVKGGLLRILGNNLQSSNTIQINIGGTVVTREFNAIDDQLDVQIPTLPSYGKLDVFVVIEGHTTDTVQAHIISDIKDIVFPCPVNFSAANYHDNIPRLLPKGQALKYRNGDSNISKFFRASADEQGRFNELVCTLFKELTALTTTELMDEWWAEYGLPGGCGDPNTELTVDMRRDMLLTKLNAQGGQTPQYYIYLASLLGYDISIIEYVITYEYPVLQCGNPMCGSVLFCLEPYFEWGVVVNGGEIGDDLICMLETYKPYHTKIRYSSTAPSADSLWVDDEGNYIIEDTDSRVIIKED